MSKIWTPPPLRERLAMPGRQRGFFTMPGGLGASKPSGGGATDPDFASVQLLLHMNGTNGSTTFTDSSSFGKPVTANGGVQISTAQSKFGGASGYFDDAGDFLSVPASSSWNFQTGNLTVECWIRPDGSSTDFVIDNRDGGGTGWAFYISSTNSLILQGTGGSPNFLESASSVITRGAWQHIAWTRSGTTNRIFVSGTQVDTNTSMTCGDSSGIALNIGRRQNAGDLFYNGWIDDVRITKGVARYTAGFTPPTAQFPDS